MEERGRRTWRGATVMQLGQEWLDTNRTQINELDFKEKRKSIVFRGSP